MCSQCKVCGLEDHVVFCASCDLCKVHKYSVILHLMEQLQPSELSAKLLCRQCGTAINCAQMAQLFQQLCSCGDVIGPKLYQKHVTMCLFATLVVLEGDVDLGVNYYHVNISQVESKMKNKDMDFIRLLQRQFAASLFGTCQRDEYALQIIRELVRSSDYTQDVVMKLGDYTMFASLLLKVEQYEEAERAADKALEGLGDISNMVIILKQVELLRLKAEALNFQGKVSESEEQNQKVRNLVFLYYGPQSKEASQWDIKYGMSKVRNGKVEAGIDMMRVGLQKIQSHQVGSLLRSVLTFDVLNVLNEVQDLIEMDKLLENLWRDYDQLDDKRTQYDHEVVSHFLVIQKKTVLSLGYLNKGVEIQLRIAELTLKVLGRWNFQTLEEYVKATNMQCGLEKKKLLIERVGVYLAENMKQFETQNTNTCQLFLKLYKKFCETLDSMMDNGSETTLETAWRARKNVLLICQSMYGKLDPKSIKVERDFDRYNIKWIQTQRT